MNLLSSYFLLQLVVFYFAFLCRDYRSFADRLEKRKVQAPNMLEKKSEPQLASHKAA